MSLPCGYGNRCRGGSHELPQGPRAFFGACHPSQGSLLVFARNNAAYAPLQDASAEDLAHCDGVCIICR